MFLSITSNTISLRDIKNALPKESDGKIPVFEVIEDIHPTTGFALSTIKETSSYFNEDDNDNGNDDDETSPQIVFTTMALFESMFMFLLLPY
ncbi:MAG: hypothetical protein ACI8RD_013204 [Bacillariaceae sp.]|jgi:hypothetical protein